MLSAIPSVGLSPLLLYSESVVLDSQLCDSTTCSSQGQHQAPQGTGLVSTSPSRSGRDLKVPKGGMAHPE